MSTRGKNLDAERRWGESTYTPKIMPIKRGFWRELLNTVAYGWRHVALGVCIGFLIAVFIYLSFLRLGN